MKSQFLLTQPGIVFRSLFLVLSFIALIGLPSNFAAQATTEEIEVFFSPKGECTQAIVAALANAKKTVYVQSYSFSSTPIAKALVEAKRRNVDVQVILDKSQKTAKYSIVDFLTHADIPVFIDEQHTIAHNKVIIIDERIIITGSFNFTKSAEEKNAENLLVITDSPLAERYSRNWLTHLKHSDFYLRIRRDFKSTNP